MGGTLRLGRGMFFEAFAVAAEISFARMLHLTVVVWNAAMRLAGVGSERRLREAIRIVDEHVTTIMESEERSRGVGDGDCCDEQHVRVVTVHGGRSSSLKDATATADPKKTSFLPDVDWTIGALGWPIVVNDATAAALVVLGGFLPPAGAGEEGGISRALCPPTCDRGRRGGRGEVRHPRQSLWRFRQWRHQRASCSYGHFLLHFHRWCRRRRCHWEQASATVSAPLEQGTGGPHQGKAPRVRRTSPSPGTRSAVATEVRPGWIRSVS